MNAAAMAWLGTSVITKKDWITLSERTALRKAKDTVLGGMWVEQKRWHSHMAKAGLSEAEADARLFMALAEGKAMKSGDFYVDADYEDFFIQING